MEEAKNTNKIRLKIFEVFLFGILTCLLSIGFGVFLGRSTSVEKINNELSPEMKKIIDNYNYIIDNFYEEIDKEVLVNGAISGMIESLGDKYTSYLNQEENENFQIMVDGSYVGIGIGLNNTIGGKIVITSIFEGSPAVAAGLEVFDIIVKIDDLDLTDKKTTDFINYVRESDKTEFELTIIRNDQTLTKTIKKDLIIIKSVNKKVYEENNKKIGYLSVDIFALNTYNQFKEQLKELEQENIDGLIIDLRDNSGGHLSVVKNMISLFLDSSKIIYQTEVKGKTEKFYSTGKENKNYPLVLLANEYSASASEVMIAALKEQYGAKMIGKTTFGKGTIQELVDVNKNESYKFTTKKWLTPKGVWINEVGIEPDYEIDQSDEFYETFDEVNDSQLKRAIEILTEY